MNNKCSVGIVGIVGVPAKYGGFETLVENILSFLAKKFDVTVFCERKAENEISFYKGANLHYLPFRANGISSIIYDSYSIFKSLKFDVILILGVSGAFILPFIYPFYKGKIVINIDGVEWKRAKWNFFAKQFLKFSEYLAVSFSNVVVTDNFHIQQHVLSTYKKESVLIEYGGDHVISTNEFDFCKDFGLNQYGYFLTVCRIEPENNIELLIEGYICSGSKIPYVIVGNFDNSIFGVNLKSSYSNHSGLMLFDPIYDQKILDELRSNCFYYLHGHSAGGTNPSLVEAMYLGLPIISYSVPYNIWTTGENALYFSSKDDLRNIITNIYQFDRNILLGKMKDIAKMKYTWERISKLYINIIE